MIRNFIIILLFVINYPFSIHSMDQPWQRPPIPMEWMPRKEDNKNGNWLKLVVKCWSPKNKGYVSLGKPVTKDVEDAILKLINTDLEKSKIGKKFHQLEPGDAFALRRAIKNGTFKYEYHYQNMEEDCQSESFKTEIDRETKGAFQEILKSKSIMGDSKSTLGNVVYLPSYILNQLYDSAGESSVILDIGGSRGIQNAPLLYQKSNVTVLDLSGEDLKHLVENTPIQFKEHLKTVEAKFPNDPSLDHLGWEGKYNAILMSHVAHYLTGEELREGIKKIYSWLQRKGRFYFQALTPYSAPYCWRMALHDRMFLDDNKNVWPGYFSQEEKYDLATRYPYASIPMLTGMPNDGHPIHPSIIKRELEDNGFKIIYLNYGTFNPSLTGERYPIPYEDLEKYVKRKVMPISRDEETRIKKAIEEFDNKRMFKVKGKEEAGFFSRLLDLVEKDTENYTWQYHQGYGCTQPLRSMETVQVIAYKK